MKDCAGCYLGDGIYKRGYFDVCEECRVKYDDLKKDAKANLLLKSYVPDAHLFKISGVVLGDVSLTVNDGDHERFTIKKPITVEDTCTWCAIRKALLYVDPWAFDSYLSEHGEYQEHSHKDVTESLWWIEAPEIEEEASFIKVSMGYPDITELPRNFIVEDLGIIGEDRWLRRFHAPSLFGRKSA